jgi:uncharacterized protein YcbK (DUF882 family)
LRCRILKSYEKTDAFVIICCVGEFMITRRSLLRACAGSAAAAALPASAFANVMDEMNIHHRIALESIHTGEKGVFDIVVNGEAVPEELARADTLLRDHRSGDVYNMDFNALKILAQLAELHDSSKPFQIISGYRSPGTNAMLAANSNGVAKKSYHMLGMAIDIALPGVELKDLQASAKSLKAGGVGIYSGSGFLHVDTGPVRYWGV